ncbi:hypothetical protein BTA51_20695 [Hahella sp. CCB-MM4]|uniref:DUF423 domain-containing protein n=1 Tax=Hahella sp. (strain CCB-MM4) TaxID=1926491 RepID=UPI000B9BBC7C|nr:DUF423 domain-containing protein [Hahella sp. CCB-MM4]OZG71368.1 hypothetical protein BTA51_20695 [Hahella sp. CCB-MM4]
MNSVGATAFIASLSPRQRIGLGIGLILIGTSVAMGAVGSHIVQLHYPEGASTFAIALRYHTLHGIGVVLLSLLASLCHRRLVMLVSGCFVAGLILFCGLLYLKSFGIIQLSGPWVPVGGMSLIIGWILWGSGVLWGAVESRSPSDT